MAKTKKKIDKNIKFSLSIGDEGAILVCLNGKQIVKRIFVTSPTSTEFVNFLSAYPNAPLYILVDVVEQAYIKHTLPPVSRLNVNKLVARKLEKDFDKNDIKSAIPMGKEKGQRKEWNWLFISARNIPPFSDWIESVSNLPNYFAGIYLLPVESMNYLKDIKKALSGSEHKTKKDKSSKKIKGKKGKNNDNDVVKDARWQIMVTHNRVGGFRQIVFKDTKVIFTRMAQPIGGQTPDIVAGNVEQETLNTIEYIRRLGYEDSEGLELFIIASSDVKEALETVPQTSIKQNIFTPFEIANLLDLSSVAEETDRFGDVILASHFLASKKHILPLFTKYTKKINTIIRYKKMIRAACILFALGTFGFTGFTYYQTLSISEDIEKSNEKKDNSQVSLVRTKSEKLGFDEDPKVVKDVSDVNNKLSKDSHLPLTFVSKLAAVKNYNTYFDEINLQITLNKNLSDLIESSFSIMFYATDQADRTLDNDAFKFAVEELFPQFDCELTCYQLDWEGLLSSSDIQLSIGKGAAIYRSTDFTRVDLSITGPQKQTQSKSRVIRRR